MGVWGKTASLLLFREKEKRKKADKTFFSSTLSACPYECNSVFLSPPFPAWWSAAPGFILDLWRFCPSTQQLCLTVRAKMIDWNVTRVDPASLLREFPPLCYPVQFGSFHGRSWSHCTPLSTLGKLLEMLLVVPRRSVPGREQRWQLSSNSRVVWKPCQMWREPYSSHRCAVWWGLISMLVCSGEQDRWNLYILLTLGWRVQVSTALPWLHVSGVRPYLSRYTPSLGWKGP